MTDFEQQMQNKWAVNGAGRIGIIEQVGTRNRQQFFSGVGIDGKPWDSMAPQVLAPSDQGALNVWRMSK